MNILYTFFLILSFSFCTTAQNDWQEHLSHERLSPVSNGHLFIDGELIIANISSASKIIGNTKPELQIEYPAFMYQRVKTTRTGIDSKELLLLEAFDYDIPGFGFTSLRNDSDTFWGKEQFRFYDFDTYFQMVPDGILIPSGSLLDQVIDHKGNLVKLVNGMLETTSPSPVSGFHEGLNDQFFAIAGDSLFSYSDDEMTALFLLPSDYHHLYNDPYNNSLVVQSGQSLEWYSYTDFSLTNTMDIAAEDIGIQFFENGFYLLTKSEQVYEVLSYTYGSIPIVTTIYQLLVNDILGFNITSFEVDDQDIYFIGVNRRNGTDIPYHYVQKRTIGKPFDPIRQDLAIDTFSVRQLNTQKWANHEYKITVRNNGNEKINSFAYSSPTLPVFNSNYSFIREHYDVDLDPGESYSITDTTNIFAGTSQISIRIRGVNYGYDSNPGNDEYDADIISLSNKDEEKLAIDIYPNPVSNILTLKGEIDYRSKIRIYDFAGQIVKYARINSKSVDISQLPAGQYYISINSVSGDAYLPFVKI